MYLKLKKSTEETMKKQIFLLAIGLLFASPFQTMQADSCNSCPCPTAVSTCNNLCTPEHGKTFLQVTPHFQAASPELESNFSSNVLHNLDRDDQHGAFEVAVFGGKSTKCSQAAAYYLPYGHSTLTFDGSVADTLQTFAQVLAESDVKLENSVAPAVDGEIGLSGVGGTTSGLTYIQTDAATYKFDGNQDTSKILPWNFGITYAALFQPGGASASGAAIGTGLVTSPTFKSSISPTLKYSHVGAGFALRYHFSDDKNGFWGLISTAVQNVKSKFCLNETVETEATPITTANFPAVSNATTVNQYGTALVTGTNSAATTVASANDYVTLNNFTAGVTPTPAINAAYIGSGFPTAQDIENATPATDYASTQVPPANVTEAFAQDAWLYGKVTGCGQKITRLADIELRLGYQWMCGDCASTNWYLGVVIPTGNKGGATYLAPAVVGNGQHAGIMTGSTTEVMLSDEADYSAWYRIDACARYLFRNTQKRSFDLLGKEWSRYMMVWANEEAYDAAIASVNANNVPNRTYTPGINVFTTDFYVKPQFQGRINQAVYFQAEHFRAELGWNIFARQTDCIQLACEWTAAPAFADSSYVGGVGLNNSRTIYNDAQTMCANVIDSNVTGGVLLRSNSGGTAQVTAANASLGSASAASYDDFAITDAQINYQSMATPGVITNTPYLTLGYAFSGDLKPEFSIGGSYEFTTSNRALNQWLLWGKFDLAF